MGGLFKITCHEQGMFCRGLSVPRFPGPRGHVSFQTVSPRAVRWLLLFSSSPAALLARLPLPGCKILDALFDNAQALAFEQLPLQVDGRLSQQQPTSRAHDAMPEDSAPAWAAGHGAPSRARAAGQFQRCRD